MTFEPGHETLPREGLAAGIGVRLPRRGGHRARNGGRPVASSIGGRAARLGE